MKVQIGDTCLKLVQGDITEQETEAIVNAANSGLLGGGGVDGAIHRAGGPEILAECQRIRARQGKLPVGQAVITTGGRLKARHVIHTVGPVWHGGNVNEEQMLANAYRNSLELARSCGLTSISFPSISTGAYRFPLDRASRIALGTVKGYLEEHPFQEVRFVLFSARDFQVYREALDEMLRMLRGQA